MTLRNPIVNPAKCQTKKKKVIIDTVENLRHIGNVSNYIEKRNRERTQLNCTRANATTYIYIYIYILAQQAMGKRSVIC